MDTAVIPSARWRCLPALLALTFLAPSAALAQSDPNQPRLVSGADPGRAPEVLLTNPTLRFLAFKSSSELGVRVATGDVNGDRVAEVIATRAQGARPVVRVFDSRTGQRLASFLAYRSSFRGGVYVAAGDVNGDGVAEIITGAGPGGGPHVRIFDGAGRVMNGFGAYGSSFRGGVFVAAGDVNGDNRDDIVAGPGPGARRSVRIFDNGGMRLGSFFAFDQSFLGGVYVGIVGDFNGDGRDDVAAARASNAPPKVRVIDGASNTILLSLTVGTYGRGGLRVAGGDINGDDVADLLVGGAEGTTKPPSAFDGKTKQPIDLMPLIGSAGQEWFFFSPVRPGP